MKKFVCAVLIVCVMCFSLCSCATRSSVYSEGTQAETKRFISDLPVCYLVTDSKTGVQYLYCKSAYSGGLTVLVNSDGTPCIADCYEK